MKNEIKSVVRIAYKQVIASAVRGGRCVRVKLPNDWTVAVGYVESRFGYSRHYEITRPDGFGFAYGSGPFEGAVDYAARIIRQEEDIMAETGSYKEYRRTVQAREAAFDAQRFEEQEEFKAMHRHTLVV